VFYANQDNKASEPVSFTVRVRGIGTSAGQSAAQGISTAAQSAAQGISIAAQAAAAGVSNGVRQGVYVTRVWAAPRLESIADYTTTTAAPAVSSALRSTAQQVRPVDETQKKSRSMLTWSLLAAAVAASAGAVAALVRYRNRGSIEAGPEEEFGPVGQAGTDTGETATQATAPAEGSAAGSQGAADSASADAGVNGRVSSSGW
jgi:hypothetical protein